MPNRRPPIDQIAITRARYDALGYPPYAWVTNTEPPPFTPLRVPLAQSRVALIGSGGLYAEGQVAFHHRDDTSFRVIDADVPTSALRTSHFAYDQTDARADPNVVFPRDTLARLARRGVIGSVCDRAYAFMGGIYSARKVRDWLAPKLLAFIEEDEPDLVLLVPV